MFSFYFFVLVSFFLSPSFSNAETDPSPYLQSGNWNLVFGDDFNGDELDDEKWEASWWGGSTEFTKPVNNHESGCYHGSQVRVNGGFLELEAVSTSDPACVKKDGSPASYVSGLINSRDDYSRENKGFTFTYGYFEANMSLAGANGEIYNWPAFWTTSTVEWPAGGEIDVMEGLSTHQPCWTYHYEVAGEHVIGEHGCASYTKPEEDFHVYAAWWQRDSIKFFYDGVLVDEQTEGVVNTRHYLIVNHAVRDSYGIHVPATVRVDYVRVWEYDFEGVEGSALKEGFVFLMVVITFLILW